MTTKAYKEMTVSEQMQEELEPLPDINDLVSEHSNITQEKQVISYLTSHDGITQLEANRVLSVGRLSARIYNLIHRDGYDIDKEMITVKNQFGKKCSVARYFLNTGGNHARN